MTETTLTAIRASDEYAARLAEFSDHYADIQRRRAALDAEEARLLARSAAYADAFADVTVPAIFPPAERQALSRRSTCAALAMATRTPERTVQRATNDAERLVNDAPAVLASLEAGRISARHAQTIIDQLSDVPTAGRTVFLAEVLAIAEESTNANLRRRARVLRERLHPESITARAKRSEADRRVEFEPAADGMAWVHLFTTAPIAQGIAERVEAAAAESRQAGDTRTCAQLQADALAALALTGVTPDDIMSSPVVPHPIEVQEHIKPTVQITVPALTMAGVSDAPGCGRRARACDLDHSVAWEDGGTTDVGNLACLCRHHHRMKHLPGWNLDHQPGGVLEWTTPDGKHHRTEPDPAPF
ncbi:HNH endonuclease [Plantibacter sp. VKM Ac-1784]|uniref:HNH endonuclease n=1 Tax=Plantibacter elymi (nom. nud.) TaxID=199708 RepID=A0ABY1RF21_9MICO|nr:HNH endonuclease signature motif containing protein [Plantibacter sp. VKM Ac-1784]SMQ72629.1 HNH endonuclease [Plantibacter sp. VKM Ac-1784]